MSDLTLEDALHAAERYWPKGNKIKCWKHEDKTPSLHLYRETNTWYCFACGAWGDAYDLQRALTGSAPAFSKDGRTDATRGISVYELEESRYRRVTELSMQFFPLLDEKTRWWPRRFEYIDWFARLFQDVTHELVTCSPAEADEEIQFLKYLCDQGLQDADGILEMVVSTDGLARDAVDRPLQQHGRHGRRRFREGSAFRA